MATEGGDYDYISPSSSYHISADNILRLVITSLEDMVWLDRDDQLQRRVIVENGDGIDIGKGLQGRGTVLGGLRWATLALEAPN